MAEGVVGRQEEPGVAAGLDHGRAGAVGQRPGVVCPVNGMRRAGLAGYVGAGRSGSEEQRVLVAQDLVVGSCTLSRRRYRQQADATCSDPLPSSVGVTPRRFTLW